MKKIPTVLRALTCLSFLFTLAQAYAGEYYAYQDANGRLVLSNYQPPAGSKIVRHQTLTDVTDAQLQEARKREDLFWLGLKIDQLNENILRLTEAIILEQDRRPIGDQINVAVGVTQLRRRFFPPVVTPFHGR